MKKGMRYAVAADGSVVATPVPTPPPAAPTPAPKPADTYPTHPSGKPVGLYL